MKPYVVIIKQMQNNKIILTEEELKSIIERAYNDGYNDGNSYYWRHWTSSPYIYNYRGNEINTITTDRTISINNTNNNTTSGLDISFTVGA